MPARDQTDGAVQTMALIAIHTLGSRGDVEPLLALGRRPKARGHRVRFATAPRFEEVVTSTGLDFSPLPGDLIDLIGTPEGKAALSGTGLARIKARISLARGLAPMARRLLAAEQAAGMGADLLVYHPKAFGGPHIAAWLGIPSFVALPLPALTPTRAFPSPILPFAGLGPLNSFSHRLVAWFSDIAVRAPVNELRRDRLGLGPSKVGMWGDRRQTPRLHAFSRAVVPVPKDWGEADHVTGYRFAEPDRNWTPSASLADFLASGPPPVYVGFGSLPTEDAAQMTALVGAALARCGQRGILATGWGGMADSPQGSSIHILKEARHDWLFPRMAAVVHHGGAGTTAAGLKAGRPTLMCPFFGDQPFWGRRVSALGAGPPPLPFASLTVERLAEAIARTVSTPSFGSRAAELGRAIPAEDGVGAAADLITAALETATAAHRQSSVS